MGISCEWLLGWGGLGQWLTLSSVRNEHKGLSSDPEKPT